MVGEGATQVLQARKSCNMNQDAATKIIGLRSISRYKEREDDPDKFTIGEFFALYNELDDFARERMWSYLEEKKATAP